MVNNLPTCQGGCSFSEHGPNGNSKGILEIFDPSIGWKFFCRCQVQGEVVAVFCGSIYWTAAPVQQFRPSKVDRWSGPIIVRVGFIIPRSGRTFQVGELLYYNFTRLVITGGPASLIIDILSSTR